MRSRGFAGYRVAVAALVLTPVSGLFAQDEAMEDYRSARFEFAAGEDYNAYALNLLQYALLEEHRKRGADAGFTIAEVNEPLQQLMEAYPLSIQGNYVVANFLEYIASMAEDEASAESMREIARQRSERADAILATIVTGRDGSGPGSAYRVINQLEEYAVLESLGLEPESQQVVHAAGVPFDVFDVRGTDGTTSSVYFDISVFYDDD